MEDKPESVEVKTWHSKINFNVGRSTSTGAPELIIETSSGPDLPNQFGGFFCIELEDTITHEQAVDLSNALNRHATYLTYTGPKRKEFKGGVIWPGLPRP